MQMCRKLPNILRNVEQNIEDFLLTQKVTEIKLVVEFK